MKRRNFLASLFVLPGAVSAACLVVAKQPDALTLFKKRVKQANNQFERATSLWHEHYAGMVITWTDLKNDGITVRD